MNGTPSDQSTDEVTMVEPIAIIGIGCRFPGSSGPEGFWQFLLEERDAITEVPADRFDIDAYYDPRPGAPGKLITRWGGFLEGVDRFAASFFGISPREAARMDPQQRLLLEVTWEALEDAGVVPEQLRGSQTGVFVGACYNDYEDLAQSNAKELDIYATVGGFRSVLSGRLSFGLGLNGPSVQIDTACSSSLVAVHLACQSLWSGESELTLAAGVNLILQPEVSIGFSRANMLSPEGRCKFGDAEANGFVRTEGVGVVVLKRLSDALAAGDRIYAVIRSSAVNNDGDRSGYLMTPSQQGQAAVIMQAYSKAGIAPGEVQYVEAHGTGTKAGDPVELEALSAVLGQGRPTERPFVVGSVKSNIGHTEGAAGIAGLIKTVLCLEHQMIPKSLHVHTPNPSIPWKDLPLELAREARPWITTGEPRMAGVNSFGIGGTNAHLVLEEAPARVETEEDAAHGPQLLPLSAESPAALRELVAAYGRFLTSTEASLAAICATAGRERTHHAERLALVASTVEEAGTALQQFVEGEGRAGMTSGQVQPTAPPKVVFVFPGQGSQWVGMGRALLQSEPVFRAEVERCEAAMRPYVSWSLLAELTADDTVSRLQEIDVVQPILFAIEVALAALWRSWGIEPAAVIGHSMGEVAAAYVAGALSLDDAARIICRRSHLLLRVSGKGAMAVVELTVAQAEAALIGYEDRVSIAVSNSPTSTVLSGDPAAITALLEHLEQDGVFCRLVKVDVASHSPQMDDLQADLLEALAGIEPRAGSVPIYSTVTTTVSDGSSCDAAYWVQNLRQPVRFATMVQDLLAAGHGIYLEMSPNPLLLGAVQQTARQAETPCLVLPSLRREDAERAVLLSSLGALYTAGVPVAWETLYPAKQHVSLPRYPWQRESFWLPQGSASSAKVRRGDGHPLLGVPVNSAVHGESHVWEVELDHELFPYLADHRVRAGAVLPAAAYVELALAAATALSGPGSHRLEQVQLTEAMLLPDEGARTVQIVLTSRMPGTATFQCFSRGADENSSSWTLHATSRVVLGSTEEAPTHPPLATIQERCQHRLSAQEHYRLTREHGLEYGPSFQGVESVQTSGDEALAVLRLAEYLEPDAPAYGIHPALLDACFQVLGACVFAVKQGAEDNSGALYLPVSIRSIRRFGTPTAGAWGHAVLEPGVEPGAKQVEGDVFLLDETGRVVLEARGMAFQRVERAGASAVQEWLYTLHWEAIESRAPETVALPPGRWLILADRGGVGQALAALLASDDRASVLVTPGERYRRLDPTAYEIDPGSGDNLRTLLEDAFGEETEPCSGIVHLWSLDATTTQAATLDSIEQAQVLGAMSVVQLVQAVADARWHRAPRLCLVTRGSQLVEGIDQDRAVTQAPLFGVGRVLVNEHPELGCRRIDLPVTPLSQEVERLLAELVADDREDEVALRPAGRYGHRLVRVPLDQPSRQEPTGASVSPDTPYRLETAEPGMLDQLVLRPIERSVPGPGEVEIQVRAAGLNFRDVMAAMGILPGYDHGVGPLGLECAGVITACGESVEGLQVGDEVVALADSSFASYVTTDAELVVPKPPTMSFEDTVTIPVTFLTAYYALIHQGRLSRGERVLIHAAAGGVGLAAVQLAQQIGAEIFATAGSPEKRAFLYALGVAHVMDSRSLAFADEIRELTAGQGVDVVLNSLAGEFIPANLSILAPFGRFLEIGKTDIYRDSQMGLLPFKRSLSFQAIDLDRMFHERPALIGSLLRTLMQDFAAGKLHPLRTTVFPITEVADAFRYMAQAKHIGKIVLSLQVDAVSVVPRQLGDGFRADATYLITGGLGGLGLAMAHWLVEQGARHLVLLGRRGATAEVEPALAALRAAGAEVLVASVDVAQEAEVAALLATIAQQMPPLRGIIHAAGLLDDGVLLQQTWERFQRVMAPKISGSWNLHHLTQHLPLDFFILFSSGAALVGSPGQGNYVAANEFLDALADARRAQGLPALSINWGPWSEVGLAARPDRGGRLALRGMSSLTPTQGVAAMQEVIGSDRAQLAVMPVDWSRWHESYPTFSASGLLTHLMDEQEAGKTRSPETTSSDAIRDTILRADAALRPHLVEEHLSGLVAKVLGLSTPKVDLQQPLARLGLDSLMAVELRNRIETTLGGNVSVVKVLHELSITQLGAVLLQQLADAPAPRSIDAEQGGITGIVPLTPRQHWLFERTVADPRRQVSQVLVEVSEEMEAALLEEAVHDVVLHHDALRMRFHQRQDGGWEQVNAAVEPHELVAWHDLGEVNGEEEWQAFRQEAIQLRRSIDLSEGPLLRIGYFKRGENEPDWLLLLVHHLVFDGFSARIVLEDLERAYRQLHRGERVQLPAKTTSFKAWAERVARFAESPEMQQEVAYWLEQPWHKVQPLPRDGSNPDDGFGMQIIKRVWLDRGETEALLQTVPHVLDVGIRDVLVTAIAQACTTWTGSCATLVDIHGHGRESIFPDVDLSRTVGCFMTASQVVADLGKAPGMDQAVQLVKRQLRAIPHGGIGYSTLPSLLRAPDVRERVRTVLQNLPGGHLPRRQFTFNYESQMAQGHDGAFSFALSAHNVAHEGPTGGPMPVHGRVAVEAFIYNQQLTLTFQYHEHAYAPETIDRIAIGVMERLKEFVSVLRLERVS